MILVSRTFHRKVCLRESSELPVSLEGDADLCSGLDVDQNSCGNSTQSGDWSRVENSADRDSALYSAYSCATDIKNVIVQNGVVM